MKILKYLFLIALLTAIGLSVFVSTQSAKFTISKSIVIKTPRIETYNFVNDFKNWGFIYTNGINPKKAVLVNKTVGIGSKIVFNGTENNVIYQTVSVFDGGGIHQIKIINGAKSNFIWTFKDTLGGTKISIVNDGIVDFKTKIYSFFKGGIATEIGKEVEFSLENLRKTLHLQVDIFDIKVNGIIKQDSTFYLKRTLKCYENDILKNVKIVVTQLQKFLVQKNVLPSGRPFLFIQKNKFNSKIITLSVCIPVTDSVITAPKGVYEFGYLEKYSGLKGTLKGNYSNILKLRTALNSEISKNKINTNKKGNYFEIHKVGILDSKIKSDWITEIIIPIEEIKLDNKIKKTTIFKKTDEFKVSNTKDSMLIPANVTNLKFN